MSDRLREITVRTGVGCGPLVLAVVVVALWMLSGIAGHLRDIAGSLSRIAATMEGRP